MFRFLFLLLPFMLFAQIGVNTENPHPESDMHLASKNKTLILNHVDDFDKITDPYEGMIIYDYIERCFRGYQQNGWSGCFGAKVEDPVISVSGPGFKGTYIRGQQLTNATFEVTVKNNTFRAAVLSFSKDDLVIDNTTDISATKVYVSGTSEQNAIDYVDVNFPAGATYTIIYKLDGTLNAPYTQLVGVWNKITLAYEDMQEIEYIADCSNGTWINSITTNNGLLKNGEFYDLEYTVPIPNSEGYSFEALNITKEGLTLTREAIIGGQNAYLTYKIIGEYSGKDADVVDYGIFDGCPYIVGKYGLNCKDILNSFTGIENSTILQSRVYTIDIDGNNNEYKPFEASCDMETDGGGWTLVLNYNHLGGTNPELVVRNKSLPILGSTNLGNDESIGTDGTNPPIPNSLLDVNGYTNSEAWAINNNSKWGHFSNSLANKMSFSELRFYGISNSILSLIINPDPLAMGNEGRVMHFKTSHSNTIKYVKSGAGNMMGLKTSYTPLNNHTSHLPASMDSVLENQGNYALTHFPFWLKAVNHWGINTGTSRWEVDDYPNNPNFNTYHQVWVR